MFDHISQSIFNGNVNKIFLENKTSLMERMEIVNNREKQK